MTRMIERWFPCSEVSDNSTTGWGSGNAERNLFTWFAARPAVQAKAAVITSLLPWPDELDEQLRLQELVRAAMTGRYAEWKSLRYEILQANPEGVTLLDPFSGRGMIPLEAARLGIEAYAVDNSPVAVLATELLTDFPLRDWSDEPELPLPVRSAPELPGSTPRSKLLADVERVLLEIGRRLTAQLTNVYPSEGGVQPWGYLWSVTLPCQECGRRFPLVGSYMLRKPSTKRATKTRPAFRDPGQSFYIDVDKGSSSFRAVIHEGLPRRNPTLGNAPSGGPRKTKGKSAICPFCGHVHPLAVHQRLAGEGHGIDAILLVGELDPLVGKLFREVSDAELAALAIAKQTLENEPDFGPFIPAVPNEQIPLNNGATIRPQLYGAVTYGDLMCERQTLLFVGLARTISELVSELTRDCGISSDYARALAGYAAATMVRMLRYSTRGAWLRARDKGTVEVAGIFVNEGTVSFSYDFFEAGIGLGPGTWSSMVDGTLSTLKGLLLDLRGRPTVTAHGSATDLLFRKSSISVVVTDPPYDAMVYYSDSSDFFYTWLKRALYLAWPELAVTADPRGIQDKTDEIIVKEHGKAPGEHRDRAHYDKKIAKAFSEMRRVVADDGLVTIVFGHGEPEVWQRLLSAISFAGLVMTASWPARTESGGQQNKANIETTLTMSCRPAPRSRPIGRKSTVEAEVKLAVHSRVLEWERSGLAPTDMVMAAFGPAMETVGRYGEINDALGEHVDISSFLPLARAAVQEAMAIEIDHYPLETFDARTRFVLWWVRLWRRQVVAKSELRWQVLAAQSEALDVRDLIPDADKGCRFVYAKDHRDAITSESSIIDVALKMAGAFEEGLEAVSDVLLASEREPDDGYLWAAMSFLADRLNDSDPDAIAWTGILRNKSSVGSVTKAASNVRQSAEARRQKQFEHLYLL